jgi:integrase
VASRNTNATRHATGLIAEYSRRYTNPATADKVRRYLGTLFEHAGKDDPTQLTENDIMSWVSKPPASNNYIRQRLSTARTFLRWCARQGMDPLPDIEEGAAQVRRSYPRAYGKVQAANPARFLTREQADQLIAACQDHTWAGSMDQLIIRLGLHGLRLAEIRNLTWRNLQDDQLHWTGKGRKPRRTTLNADTAQRLEIWRRQYDRHVHTDKDRPIICATANGAPPTIRWGEPMPANTIREHVTHRAALAGLGHVAPHDLRRTAASILHNARDEAGGHLFDLLDIQHVLGHSDPAVTMRCYIEQVSNETLEKAAAYIG